ncbi:glycosyltransferase family 4 protein [Anaerolinea sp.]|uniref:glycosyltransferase family 4 protein n=1 Tax=Anaerolinea sp. TaxID=1872519 RepID=UPI002629F347|nr:glycosyltransferase family 4 protein [uncultured Anaerolinea sp.]
MSVSIPYRVGIQQRVLPAYRAAFFDRLAQVCEGGLSVFAGQPRPEEALGQPAVLRTAQHVQANNLHLGTGRLYTCVQRNLFEWLGQWNPDVLIVEANPRYLSTPAAVRWMHARHKPVIGWGLGAPPSRGFWREVLRQRFLCLFDALITYSQRGAEQYLRLGFSPDRIFVAPNAVTPRPKGNPPEKPPAFTSGQPVLLFVGRLQARKRVDLLIRACAALAHEVRPRLIVVGEGPERQALEALAKTTYPDTHFTGEKRDDELEPYWHMADLFVLPGTGGLAVQQAMAHALPVMVAEADGTQEDLVTPENGWRLIPGNLEDLIQRLQEALSQPGRLREMGKASYQIVAERVNLDEMVAVFAQAIHSAMRLRG